MNGKKLCIKCGKLNKGSSCPYCNKKKYRHGL